jgi:hypothetical protein
LGDGLNLLVIQSDHRATIDDADGRGQGARPPDFGLAIARRLDVVWRGQPVRDDSRFQGDHTLARANGGFNSRRY